MKKFFKNQIHRKGILFLLMSVCLTWMAYGKDEELSQMNFNATQLLFNKKYDDALALCNSVISTAINQDNYLEIDGAYDLKIRCLDAKNEHDSTEGCLLDELTRFQSQSKSIADAILPNTYAGLAHFYYDKKDFVKAEEYHKKGKGESSDVFMGDCEYQLGNYTSAIHYYEDMMNFTHTPIYSDSTAIRSSDPKDRIAHKKASADFAKYITLIIVPKNIGDCYKELHNYSKSTEYYYMAREYLVSHEDMLTEMLGNSTTLSHERMSNLSNEIDNKLQECEREMKQP